MNPTEFWITYLIGVSLGSGLTMLDLFVLGYIG
ncbi:hypothetical protein LCGC14_1428040 [marine sediment metagenome]|uniref:Uncharacterized protein n=1 Tax=marine sediment metagenome TaxID=412755 RepID=A0A0F9JPS0_9ZZZZ